MKGTRALIGLVAATAALAVLSIPGALDALPGTASATPVLPETLASYTPITAPLAPGAVPQVALTYQHGYAYETFDLPQSLALGADGATTRRIDPVTPRSLTLFADDPATVLLAPDGRSMMLEGDGQVTMRDLADGSTRSLPVDGAGTVHAASWIGDTVILLDTADKVGTWMDVTIWPPAEVLRLDLATGDVARLDVPDAIGVALSPDGSRLALTTGESLLIADAETGEKLATGPAGRWLIDGDAWSPDGSRLAVTENVSSPAVSDVTVISAAGDVLGSHAVAAPDASIVRAIGWRDEATVLVDAERGFRATELSWLDTGSGAQEVVSTAAVGGTGATMGELDAARDLVAAWNVREVAASPSPLPLFVTLPLAVLVGLLAYAFARSIRAARRRPPRAVAA